MYKLLITTYILTKHQVNERDGSHYHQADVAAITSVVVSFDGRDLANLAIVAMDAEVHEDYERVVTKLY